MWAIDEMVIFIDQVFKAVFAFEKWLALEIFFLCHSSLILNVFTDWMIRIIFSENGSGNIAVVIK